MRALPIVLSISLYGCSAASSSGPHFRFESVGPLPGAQGGGIGSVVGLGDDVFVASGGNLWALDSQEAITPASDAVLLAGKIVTAGANGVSESADGQSFTSLSEEPMQWLAATDGALVGARMGGVSDLEVLRSTDGGSTWTVIATGLELDVGAEDVGAVLSEDADGIVFARIVGDQDPGPNWAFAGKTFEVRGEAVTPIGSVPGGPLPTGTTLDGRVIVDIKTTADGTPLNTPYESLPVALVNSYRPDMTFEDATRVRFSMPNPPLAAPEPRTFGTDSEGRLLMALGDDLVRSELELTLANDQSGDILGGPGCTKRSSFEGFNGDRPDSVTVTNDSDDAVSVWHIDQQYRWFRDGEVAAGQTADIEGFGLVRGTFLMALRANGDCAAGQFIKDSASEVHLTVQ